MAPVTTLPKPQTPRSIGSFDQRITLPVPYLCQRDSVTAQGLRMCFSSTCAMAAAYLKPGCLAGASQLDDRYLALLQRHGDTTDAAAQIQTLRSLGIEAELRTDGRIEQLIAQLRMGIPVPVGWLHHGPVSAPSGGGHWSLVVGWDPTRRAVLMHDPTAKRTWWVAATSPPRSAAAGARAIRSRTGAGAGWWRGLVRAGGWSWRSKRATGSSL
jgi:hypothetical protein